MTSYSLIMEKPVSSVQSEEGSSKAAATDADLFNTDSSESLTMEKSVTLVHSNAGSIQAAATDADLFNTVSISVMSKLLITKKKQFHLFKTKKDQVKLPP